MGNLSHNIWNCTRTVEKGVFLKLVINVSLLITFAFTNYANAFFRPFSTKEMDEQKEEQDRKRQDEFYQNRIDTNKPLFQEYAGMNTLEVNALGIFISDMLAANRGLKFSRHGLPYEQATILAWRDMWCDSSIRSSRSEGRRYDLFNNSHFTFHNGKNLQTLVYAFYKTDPDALVYFLKSRKVVPQNMSKVEILSRLNKAFNQKAKKCSGIQL